MILDMNQATVLYTCPMHSEVRQVGPGVCPKCGMALEPESPLAAEDHSSSELSAMSRRFWVCLALTIPVVFMAMRLTHPPTFVQWVELLLSPPVVFWGGWPFFDCAWQSLVNRSPNMFTLIALGTGCAYLYSVCVVAFAKADLP